MIQIFDDSVKTGNNINTSFFGDNFWLDFVTHGNDGFIWRSDEYNTILLQFSSKFVIFGKKTVTGVDCLGASFFLKKIGIIVKNVSSIC